MSKEKWASIIYGRSHHLDFRFIAIPEDFGEPEMNWALPYILATIQKPKKLSLNPRWSLFKNQSHCIAGVTCMVRDLVEAKDLNFTKDDKDRPLYVFVGYVAKLTNKQYLIDVPPYNHKSLQDFQGLYDYVKQVWQVKDFHKNSHDHIKTNYETRIFSPKSLAKNFCTDLLLELNHQQSNPDKVFLWQDKPEQNSKLWATSAICSQSVSLCLGNSYRQKYFNHPFLNQTSDSINKLTVEQRLTSNNYSGKSSREQEGRATKKVNPLTELLANKVKEDITITRDHALQLKEILINNLNNQPHNLNPPQPPEIKLASLDSEMLHTFGFKEKTCESKILESDWF
ncbi:MAG: hypothetical protein QNJ32_14945 [Xenococcaceae cyanobacterium MO_167.B27]|nr:hypothetical protein [Xenococcaceae cyanobacterium MO_167.B27]